MEQLADELSASHTTAEQREAIATRIGIQLDDGPIAEILARPLEGDFEAAAESTLTPMVTGSSSDVAKLVKLRIFFETVMAMDIALDQERKLKVLRKLAEAQAYLRKLAMEFDQGESVFSEFWKCDGEFHRIICVESGRSHLASVVDIVVRLCGDLGTPRNRQDLQATLHEHESIIAAITSTDPSDAAILEAVEAHVGNAYRRWFLRDRHLTDEGSSAMEDVQDYCPDGIAESQQAFRRDLPKLLSKHRGKWVAYNRSSRLFFGRNQHATYQRCLKARIDRNEFIVRYVDVEAEECEYSCP